MENLRDTFVNHGRGPAFAPFDIKAEKDDFFEIGPERTRGSARANAVAANVYYKSALTDLLDDAQLLNTSIAQPFNFATGYAYGIELSAKGQINDEWSDYVNYSFEIAKGQGISGGVFAFQPGQPAAGDRLLIALDHVQEHTANMGVTYAKSGFWVTGQGLFGSGLCTGPANSLSLPDHFTVDYDRWL